MSFTVLQSKAFLGFDAQLKYPQSLILAAIRGVTPRCPSEVEGCHREYLWPGRSIQSMQRGLAEAKSLMESSGIPNPGHKTGLLSQNTTHFIESMFFFWLRLKIFFSRTYILFDSVRSLTLNQKGLNLGQRVFANPLAVRWLKRFLFLKQKLMVCRTSLSKIILSE